VPSPGGRGFFSQFALRGPGSLLNQTDSSNRRDILIIEEGKEDFE